MLNKLMCILLFILVSYKGKTQFILENIITKSREYYSGINNGTFKVTYTFKPSIAESFSSVSFDISFCKKEGVIKTIAENIEIIVSKDKYYYIDKIGNRFIDFSENKFYKKENKESLEQYPYFKSNYFERFKKGKFKAELSGKLFHVYDFSEHFYFDTLNFSILQYKSLIYDPNGLQIREWYIEKQNIQDICTNETIDFSFFNTCKKVKSFRDVKENPDYRRVDFRKLIQTPYLHISGPDSISVDSLSGKYILIDFFYQSCMPCILSFKRLKELYHNNNANKNLVIIGVDPVLQDSSTMGKFKKRYKLEHDVMVGSFANSINSIFNPAGIFPFQILINPKGEIIETQEGYSEIFFKKLEEIISK